MNVFGKVATVVAAFALASQPCLAASVGSAATPAAPEQISFNLSGHGTSEVASRFAAGSVTLAASQQTASESQDEPRRRGPGTTTWLVVGGVLLLVLVAVAVANAAPAPGPEEGAFD